MCSLSPNYRPRIHHKLHLLFQFLLTNLQILHIPLLCCLTTVQEQDAAPGSSSSTMRLSPPTSITSIMRPCMAMHGPLPPRRTRLGHLASPTRPLHRPPGRATRLRAQAGHPALLPPRASRRHPPRLGRPLLGRLPRRRLTRLSRPPLRTWLPFHRLSSPLPLGPSLGVSLEIPGRKCGQTGLSPGSLPALLMVLLILFLSLLLTDRKSTRLNSSHSGESRMPSSA